MTQSTTGEPNPEQKITQTELLEQIRQKRRALEETIAPLNEAQLSRPGPEGWAIKDHLAHLAAWELGVAELLRGRPRFRAMGVEQAVAQGKSMDEVNDLIYQQHANLPLPEVLKRFQDAHSQMLSALEALEGEDLARPYASFVPGGQDDRHDPVVGWVIGNTFAHFDEHREYIRALLEEGDCVIYPTLTELEAALAGILQSPKEAGRLEMIVARPQPEQRQVLETAELSVAEGLVGDGWAALGSSGTPDGRANPEAQIALMNSRVIRAIAGDRPRWALAGDQLVVDLDLSQENLAPGARLAIGTALLEVTALPHTGCQKFTERFGHDAIRWVNSPEGRKLRLRGMYARVIQPGTIRVGDRVVVQPG